MRPCYLTALREHLDYEDQVVKQACCLTTKVIKQVVTPLFPGDHPPDKFQQRGNTPTSRYELMQRYRWGVRSGKHGYVLRMVVSMGDDPFELQTFPDKVFPLVFEFSYAPELPTNGKNYHKFTKLNLQLFLDLNSEHSADELRHKLHSWRVKLLRELLGVIPGYKDNWSNVGYPLPEYITLTFSTR